MLQTANRLVKVRDFNLIMKYGQWINGQFLDLKVLNLAKIQSFFPKKEDPDKFKNQLRIAFSIGLKISKSAVKRNQIKRRLREVIRLLIKEGRLIRGYYLLFVARPVIKDKDYTEISQETKLLLTKSKLLL